MENYKISENNMVMWLVCTAIGKENDKIKQMRKNEVLETSK